MTPRHFGHAVGFERTRSEEVLVENRAAVRWTVAAVVGAVLLLGGIGLYTFNAGVRTLTALAPLGETSGQGTRPTLPSLPQ